MTRNTTNMIRKMTKRTWAIQAAVPARPVNPKIAAMIATIRKVMAQDSIISLLAYEL
jgi:hypothetical protein